jgi:hypothetical protein
VLLVESPPERTLQIAIGECKGSREITADDVQKLALVADALIGNRDCEAFIVFSKTGPFTPEEVERCKSAQRKYKVVLPPREVPESSGQRP